MKHQDKETTPLSAHDRNRGRIENMKATPEVLEALKQQKLDLLRLFTAVFNNEDGQKMIKHLEEYSHINFPNYENVNATYSKIGEQTLVAYIKGALEAARKKGE